jgi:hypothetical protein
MRNGYLCRLFDFPMNRIQDELIASIQSALQSIFQIENAEVVLQETKKEF